MSKEAAINLSDDSQESQVTYYYAFPVRDQRSYGAFSLIEILIVISIISLLLGILLPTLSRAKALAQQAVCWSRLHQWGLAFEAYAVANDNFYPHIDGLDRDAGRADWFGWVDVLPPLMPGLAPRQQQ